MPATLTRAVTLARPARLPSEQDIQKMLRALDRKIDFLAQEEKKAFGIERSSVGMVVRQRQELEQKKTWLQNQIRFSPMYKILSDEPLKWRGKKGLPLLVPFSLDSSTFVIEANQSSAFIHNPGQLPAVITHAYKDVLVMLSEKARRDQFNYVLTYQFTGIIPDSVRDKIRSAQSKNLKVAIISEPTEVRLVRQPIPRIAIDYDPLVVGVDTSSQIWLIAEFDVTSIEAKYRDYLNL